MTDGLVPCTVEVKCTGVDIHLIKPQLVFWLWTIHLTSLRLSYLACQVKELDETVANILSTSKRL